jgi:hypothetical protein
VDLEIASEDGQMVQRLAAQPGADLNAVRLRVEGADSIAVDDAMLRLSSAAGEVAWPLLLAKGTGGDGEVQLRSGQMFDIATPFKLTEVNPGSAVANPQSVTDNPAELLYSTYLGGSNGDYASSVTVDGAGCAYVTGYTSSTGFPTTSGAFDGTFDSSEDAFVVKSCARNSTLAYATFLGGGYYDQAMSIAVNGDGQAFVTGWTNSWKSHVVSRYATERMLDYEELTANVTRSSFEHTTVTMNWNQSNAYATSGYVLPPEGVLVQRDDGSLIAGIFTAYNGAPLSSGDHYLIEERGANEIIVRQPMGANTSLRLTRLPGWDITAHLSARAYGRDGHPIGSAPVSVAGAHLTFTYHPQMAGQPVAYYRITAAQPMYLPLILRR